VTSPFYATVGFEVDETTAHGAVVRANELEPLRNREGWCHGGAIAALADAAATQAAARSGGAGRGSATVELTVSYLDSAVEGPLVARGEVVAVHDRRIEVRVEIRANDRVVAVARAMVVRGRT